MDLQRGHYLHYILLSLLLLIGVSCQAREPKFSEEVYTIKPTHSFRIYGIEVDKVLSNNFSQIEKTLRVKIKTDEEVSIIFISRDGDFVSKTQITDIKDHIDVLYGPLEDLSLYKKAGTVMPQSIVFYGTLSINEPASIKQTILKELKKNIPSSNSTTDIFQKIDNYIVNPEPTRIIKINFDIQGYPNAYFFITHDRSEIIYRYVFSTAKEVYPYL